MMPRSLLSYLALTLLCLACKHPVGVDPFDDDRWFRAASRSALTNNRPSAFSMRVLRNHKLDDDFRIRPLEVLETLQETFRRNPTRDNAFVIAELAYLRGKPLGDRSEKAAFLYMSAMMYAYAYLFEEDLGADVDYYNPRFRLACDLYNRSLAKLIRYTETRDVPWGDPFALPSLAGEVILDDGERVMDLPPNSFHSFKTVYEFKVRGLENVYRTPGIGVPLILLRHPPPPGAAEPFDRFLEREVDQVWTATSVVRFDGSVLDDAPHHAAYSLYDPLRVTHTTVGNRKVPLETDLTTPLAYSIQLAPPASGIEGLLDAEAWDDIRGLYVTQPYDPNKIPIVFIHGLLSSPMTWLKTANDVWGTKYLRDHYQVWYFLYPTGNPIVYSATILRESLLEARAVFDPDGDDPAFNDMVLVGHSMGGLLARLQVAEANGELWDRISNTPFDDLDIPEDIHTWLREMFYFKPLPFIKRVIFLAVPHRGSNVATSLSGLASSVIKLPGQVMEINGLIMAELDRAGDTADITMWSNTSVDDLAPESPDMQFISSREIPADVRYHSIIADSKRADVPGGTDTIVPYDSAHLEGAESELIVQGTHSCTADPLVIREIERILLLHAREYDSSHTQVPAPTD